VGKTVAMLDEGHRRASRGTDVVVGLCETHGRSFTASMLDGLEQTPLKKVEYHGTVLEEMDTDAILARHPSVVLVDELAHTNAPGSRHEKRYQDVLDLLGAGIDVISTVNIQHLESLNDAVAAITGIVQKETVPDEVVRAADQIELVDMSPDALRRRMTHGHIYMPDQVNAALANYFRPGNLSALRELALLWLADKVESGLEDYRSAHAIGGAWPVRERVVVALSGGPGGEALLRRGARIASRLAGGQLLAAYVVRPDGLASAPLGTVAKLQGVTQELGGEFHTIAGDDPTKALLDFARGVNATQILVGTATLPWWRRAIAPTFASQVIAEAGDIDVHVVNRQHADAHLRGRREGGLSSRRFWAGMTAALVLPAAVTGLLYVSNPDPATTLGIPIYLLATVVVAAIGGAIPAIVAAVWSGLLLNWFFVTPVASLTMTDPQGLAAWIAFVVVGVMVSVFVHLNARRTKQALAAQRESAALAELSHSLLGSTEQLSLLLSRAVDMFGVQAAAVVRLAAFGKPVVIESVGEFDPDADADHERIDDDHALAIQPPGLPASQRRLFAAFAVHAGAIIQREALTQTAADVSRVARDNASKTELLSAVSHDLRTPLLNIRAAVERLRSREEGLESADKEDLGVIRVATGRLHALIANLLQLSRLQTGDVVAHIAPVDLRDVVHDIAGKGPDPSRVRWTIDPAVGPVPADAALLRQALRAVVNNAVRRQPDDSRVTVGISRIADRTEIRVVDTGANVPGDDFDRIFAPFQQMDDTSDDADLILGPAVARGLVEVIGGTVTAETTPGGGLTVVLSLPGTTSPE